MCGCVCVILLLNLIYCPTRPDFSLLVLLFKQTPVWTADVIGGLNNNQSRPVNPAGLLVDSLVFFVQIFCVTNSAPFV